MENGEPKSVKEHVFNFIKKDPGIAGDLRSKIGVARFVDRQARAGTISPKQARIIVSACIEVWDRIWRSRN